MTTQDNEIDQQTCAGPDELRGKRTMMAVGRLRVGWIRTAAGR
ncbi:MAG TPA: hypothetical protein VJM47_10615 [Nitrosospira sp.]|nr:hypothetical protein [Nitrosospira sp.]